jgi:glucose dehydrogenase
VNRLKVAWVYDTGEDGGIETSPLIVGRTLYAYTPSRSKVVNSLTRPASACAPFTSPSALPQSIERKRTFDRRLCLTAFKIFRSSRVQFDRRLGSDFLSHGTKLSAKNYKSDLFA